MRNARGRLIAAVVLCALAGPLAGVAAFSSRLTMSGRLQGRRVLVTGGGELAKSTTKLPHTPTTQTPGGAAKGQLVLHGLWRLSPPPSASPSSPLF